jgi:transcriptional antiterminator RfaH
MGSGTTPCGSRGGGSAWYVVMSHPQAERRAAQHLDRQGYQAYLPLLAVRQRDRVVRSMWHAVQVPLFPRYLFVRFDAARDPWRPVLHTLGVASLVRVGNLPIACPDGAVEALVATEDGRRTLEAPRALFAPGDAVSLGAGTALEGHQGVIVKLRRSTASVAILLFGGLRQVTVPLDALHRL